MCSFVDHSLCLAPTILHGLWPGNLVSIGDSCPLLPRVICKPTSGFLTFLGLNTRISRDATYPIPLSFRMSPCRARVPGNTHLATHHSTRAMGFTLPEPPPPCQALYLCSPAYQPADPDLHLNLLGLLFRVIPTKVTMHPHAPLIGSSTGGLPGYRTHYVSALDPCGQRGWVIQ